MCYGRDPDLRARAFWGPGWTVWIPAGHDSLPQKHSHAPAQPSQKYHRKWRARPEAEGIKIRRRGVLRARATAYSAAIFVHITICCSVTELLFSLLRDVFYLNRNKTAAIKIQKLLLYVKVVGRAAPVESLNRIPSTFDSLTLYKTQKNKKIKEYGHIYLGFKDAQ